MNHYLHRVSHFDKSIIHILCRQIIDLCLFHHYINDLNIGLMIWGFSKLRLTIHTIFAFGSMFWGSFNIFFAIRTLINAFIHQNLKQNRTKIHDPHIFPSWTNHVWVLYNCWINDVWALYTIRLMIHIFSALNQWCMGFIHH